MGKDFLEETISRLGTEERVRASQTQKGMGKQKELQTLGIALTKPWSPESSEEHSDTKVQHR